MRQNVEGSGHVEWIDWDPRSRVLSVKHFRREEPYRYEGVDYDTWVRLMRAPSKGSFLRREIQPRFRVIAA
jgi:hypothetical protein